MDEEKTTYTFCFEFALRVCELCRDVDGNFSPAPKSEFYECYRDEISKVEDDMDDIVDKIEEAEDELELIKDALEYVDTPSLRVNEEEYFGYPDWLRVLFKQRNGEYQLRLNDKLKKKESEVMRLRSNLDDKRDKLRHQIQKIVRISSVDDDDWVELLRKVHDDEFEFAYHG